VWRMSLMAVYGSPPPSHPQNPSAMPRKRMKHYIIIYTDACIYPIVRLPAVYINMISASSKYDYLASVRIDK